MNRIKEIEARLADVCEQFDCQSYQIVPGGKHRKLILRRGGEMRTVTFSSTPGDPHAVDQAGRDARRALKELGYAVS